MLISTVFDLKSRLNETTYHLQRMEIIHLPTKTKMLFIVNQVSQLCNYTTIINELEEIRV